MYSAMLTTGPLDISVYLLNNG